MDITAYTATWKVILDPKNQESTKASALASASAKLGHISKLGLGLGLGQIGPKLAEFQIKIFAIIFPNLSV